MDTESNAVGDAGQVEKGKSIVKKMFPSDCPYCDGVASFYEYEMVEYTEDELAVLYSYSECSECGVIDDF